jgi:hypothetical protein
MVDKALLSVSPARDNSTSKNNTWKVNILICTTLNDTTLDCAIVLCR